MSSAGARERDPYFRKIMEGLAGHIDHQAFEECAQDLLRDAIPSLVGVHGGSDAGMDGAIADGEGEPYALIVTTQKNVIGNLTRSLRSRLAARDTRRRAVLATSEALTPRRRRHLKERARELGFVLLQTYDRRNIASRLYRDSRWTRTLLGITGEPPALSTFPRTRRPLIEVEPVGRDEDLVWLRETAGDRVLVGEPGSGKTFLLRQLVLDGKALFLATEDGARFAEAWREQRPEIVLVDDAHVRPQRLDRLRQIRHDIQAEGAFTILATSWTGAWNEVAEALGGVPDERVRHLELLTPSEILEVLHRIGLEESDDSSYLAELVNQADHRPGLAVTLGSLWLGGAYHAVLTGQALLRSLVPALRRWLDQDPTQLLAAFALGGDRGMGLKAVADFLGSPIGEIWEATARIGASGVLSEQGKDAAGEPVLAVNPRTFRAALLHEVFFSAGGRPWRQLLRQAPSLSSAIDTLILAANREVPVPRHDLQELLLEASSPNCLRGFASLGEAEGTWVLENYRGPASDVAEQTLETAPEATIRLLLDEAEAKAGARGSQALEPLGLLRAWIEEVPTPPAGLTELLARRRHLVKTALERLRDGGNAVVALRAAFMALAPRLESTRMSAAGGAVVLRQGSLPGSAVPEMLRLWERVRVAIPALDLEIWNDLENALHWWLYPNLPRADLGEDELEPFRRMAGQVLRDLVPFAEGHPGLTAALLERARDIGVDLELEVDPDFETLYPSFPPVSGPDGLRSVHEARRTAEKTARSLARNWADRPPRDVVEDLARYAEEARWIRSSLGTRPEFEDALVKAVEAPEQWLNVLLEEGGLSTLAGHLLYRVVGEQRPGWKPLLERCLSARQYSWAASRRVLELPDPPEALLESAIAVTEPQIVEAACLQGRVSVATLARLLAGTDPRIAVAAAAGEWLSEPRQTVRSEVREQWRAVVLSIRESELGDWPEGEFWLKEMLSNDGDLAFDWLRSQFAQGVGGHALLVQSNGVIATAVRALDETQRAGFLQEMAPDALSESLVSTLVGDSVEVYRKLLGRSELWAYHLAPLAGRPPDSTWSPLAELALDAGHDPRDVAAESLPSVRVFRPGMDRCSKLEAAFRRLSRSKDPKLREVARHGIGLVEEWMEREKAGGRRSEIMVRR